MPAGIEEVRLPRALPSAAGFLKKKRTLEHCRVQRYLDERYPERQGLVRAAEHDSNTVSFRQLSYGRGNTWEQEGGRLRHVSDFARGPFA